MAVAALNSTYDPRKSRCIHHRRNARILTLILSLLVFLTHDVTGQLDNNLLSRKIHLSQTRGTIQFFLEEMTSDHQLYFSYDPGKIPLDKKVNLLLADQNIEQILNRLFTDTDVRFSVFDDLIILSRILKYTVSGFIEDDETGERMIGATIMETNSGMGTVSNNYGFFSLTIPEGIIVLDVSFVGYAIERKSIALNKDTTIVYKLVPGVELDEVVVTSGNLEEQLESSRVSTNRISLKSLEQMPMLLGEVDIMKMMEYLPGVQFGTEASSGIVVRGGNPEQNLILLDGVPIYNSNHAFGLFSVFNSDAIKNLSLIKGGFPARYGGRLSSVIDVRMKEGNMKGLHGNVTIGTVASKFTFEGPLVKERSSFLITARRTYIDLFTPKKDGDIPSFFFYDINAKVNQKLINKDRLFLSFYTGHDRFQEKETYKDFSIQDMETNSAEWGNRTFLMRWNHLFSKKLFSNFSFIYSKYGLGIDLEEKEIARYQNFHAISKYNSGINDISVKLDFDYYPTIHKIKFGLEYFHHTFNPGRLEKTTEEYVIDNGMRYYTPTGNIDEVSRNDIVYAKEFRAFLEDDFAIGNNWVTNIGLHYSGFLVDGKYYTSIEPRVSTGYSFSDKLVLKGAFSRMAQYLHLMTHSGMGLPTDLWLPVTSTIKPQFSNQVTLGLDYRFNDTYKLNFESYYKFLDQIYAYREGVDYLSADNSWQHNIELGVGKSLGMELMLSRNGNNLDGWITYTYSKSDRKFNEVNNGKPFPYKYDRTHQLNTVANYKINPKLSVSATWIYATGMAYTLSTQKYISLFGLYDWNVASGDQTDYIDVLEERNNARMPDYHRMDISVSYYKVRKRLDTTWSLSVYNLYNRFNPYLIYWDNDPSDDGKRKQKHVALFSVIPSLSLRIDF